MDVLRKMFQQKEEPIKKENETEDGFRKSNWFDSGESDDQFFDDDRRFAFEIFTSPLELQKHFERQMQQILEAVSQLEESDVTGSKNFKEEFLKPGFEKRLSKAMEKNSQTDTDLDGEIIADELHSLLEKFKDPENGHSILPRNDNRHVGRLYGGLKKKLTDEEKIFGKIHGTLIDEESSKFRPRIRSDVIPHISPMVPRNGQPFGGVFDDNYKGPKLFRQSIVTKTIRKPDGSSETTQIRQDSDGNKTTTVTRTKNGKSETFTKYDNPSSLKDPTDGVIMDTDAELYSDRNIYVSKQGYALPRNIC